MFPLMIRRERGVRRAVDGSERRSETRLMRFGIRLRGNARCSSTRQSEYFPEWSNSAALVLSTSNVFGATIGTLHVATSADTGDEAELLKRRLEGKERISTSLDCLLCPSSP